MKPNNVSRLAARVLAAAIVGLGGGCATRYEVKVTSINRATPADRDIASYDVRARPNVAAEDSLRYKEAAQHIKTALSARGLYEAPTGASADMIVEIDYEIAPPRLKYEDCSTAIFAVARDANDGRNEMDPTKEVVAYKENRYSVVIREKRLSVCGRKNQPAKEGRPPEEIWRVDVSIEDESHDLREYLPILASAAMDEIGRNTDGTTTTTLKEDDEAIRFIKKGL